MSQILETTERGIIRALIWLVEHLRAICMWVGTAGLLLLNYRSGNVVATRGDLATTAFCTILILWALLHRKPGQ